MGKVGDFLERRRLEKEAANDDPQAIRALNEKHIEKNVAREAKENKGKDMGD